MEAPSPPRRGRKRQYLDDAERHRAFRERRQVEMDRGDLARQLLKFPTPLLVERIAHAIVASASDQEQAVVALRHALETGIRGALGSALLHREE